MTSCRKFHNGTRQCVTISRVKFCKYCTILITCIHFHDIREIDPLAKIKRCEYACHMNFNIKLSIETVSREYKTLQIRAAKERWYTVSHLNKIYPSIKYIKDKGKLFSKIHCNTLYKTCHIIWHLPKYSIILNLNTPQCDTITVLVHAHAKYMYVLLLNAEALPCCISFIQHDFSEIFGLQITHYIYTHVCI